MKRATIRMTNGSLAVIPNAAFDEYFDTYVGKCLVLRDLDKKRTIIIPWDKFELFQLDEVDE